MGYGGDVRYVVGVGCTVVGNGIRLMTGMGLLKDMDTGNGICDGDGDICDALGDGNDGVAISDVAAIFEAAI